MKNTRLKQFAASLLIVLSLFVSSISACACSHHQPEKTETPPASCHSHTPMNMAETDSKASQPEKIETVISEDVCNCVQPAPKVVSKNENLKIGKQPAELLSTSAINFKVILPAVEAKAIHFAAPFYLSDSFYNLAPSRGPPCL